MLPEHSIVNGCYCGRYSGPTGMLHAEEPSGLCAWSLCHVGQHNHDRKHDRQRDGGGDKHENSMTTIAISTAQR